MIYNVQVVTGNMITCLSNPVLSIFVLISE